MVSTPVFYIKCSNPVNSSLYVDTAPCLNINASSLVQQKTYSYVKVGDMEVGDLNEGCSAEWVALALLNYSKGYNTSYEFIHSALTYGFELRGDWPYDEEICKHKWRKYHTCYPHTIPVYDSGGIQTSLNVL
ncbi:rust resistance kinase Lr10 [Prunus yedoensis var. nudiflora]|uniref:Rust resistance kinase Lr10 n=1 Tax=Prunus yedoensis var. nudiflora TaxID=2094558 RepID=A0A314Y0I5_PRUYE|nr:rust resistance kinase Lr10 [Prunus yedoensis var. nudiflora]